MEIRIEELLDAFRKDAPTDELMIAKLKAIDECLKPKNLKEACLLIIDMQKGFLEEGAALEVPDGRTKCAPNIEKLLIRAREIGLNIVFTKYVHRPGSSRLSAYPFAPEVFEHRAGSARGPFHPSSCCMVGDPTAEIVDELKPLQNEIVIEKQGYDAFHETHLDSGLRSRGINYMYICGVMTDICVDSTIRSGFHREYRITVASDAVATIWPNIQEACLDIWKRKFCRIRMVDEILNEWGFLKNRNISNQA